MTTSGVTEQAQAVRAVRAIEIAKTKRISKRGPAWIVPSQSHGGSYVVTTEVVHGMPTWECTCPDFETRGQPCKHVIAVEIVRTRSMPDGTTVTETLRVTYGQDWPKYNAAQVHEKERFALLLRDLCQGIQQPPQKMGRPRHLMSDLIFAAGTKIYSTQSARRAHTDVRTEKEKGLVEKAPCYQSILNTIADPKLTPLLRALVEESAAPLAVVEHDFAVDSTGFATSVYRRWYDHKYGRERSEHAWVKAHLTCGVKTNVVTAIQITPEDGADSPQFKTLVNTTAKRFRIAEVSADKAYLSRENVALVDALGAEPYIPFKDGTGTGIVDSRGQRAPHAKLWARLYHAFMFDREKYMKHYHKRSNIETTNHMIKSKFGASVRSKTFPAQVNEVYLKVLCHNIVVLVSAFYELGIEPQFAQVIDATSATP